MGGLFGLCAASIVFAPAAWLANALDSQSAGRVLLHEVRGTVWSGSGELMLAGGEGSAGLVRLPSRLSWELRPQGFGLNVQLSSACCTRTGPLHIRVQWSGDALSWELSRAHASFPASLLMGLGAPWNTLQLTGDLTLNSQQLAGRWSAAKGFDQVTGQADVQADHLTTALSTVRPLGSYQFHIAGPEVRLETKKNESQQEMPLQLTGFGQLAQGRFSFTGEALAAKGREEALTNLLHMIGQSHSSADGRLRSTLKI